MSTSTIDIKVHVYPPGYNGYLVEYYNGDYTKLFQGKDIEELMTQVSKRLSSVDRQKIEKRER